MRSLINRSRSCRDSETDPRDREHDRRAGEYVEELKRRCGSSRWNLVEVDFGEKHRRRPINDRNDK